ncbi:alpha/beta fold hydrolase [Amaricoccus sp.]|uniref:alpha/beta fold hydrolase n=1 Tax=Amaricoccus sp. TaxID=1872485 RepID=UPI0026213AE0|nr:alpha/beta hydrolase [Amaricoccus sp.]HRO13348.1 alpha/beta hydrolase [Amaricoccus sp.]
MDVRHFLHAPARGAGRPVVALHGSAGSGAAWRGLAGYLEGRFRVVTPDLPGYGGSPPRGRVGLAGDAAAVMELIGGIGEPVHLVGHGWGGLVALRLAVERPQAVASLTLVEPAAFHLLRAGAAADRRLYAEVMALGAAFDPAAGPARREAAMRLLVDYWNGAGAWGRTSARLRGRLLASHDRLHGEFRALAEEPARPGDLARIACPTLAIMGLDSPLPSLRVTDMIAGLVPRATLRIVPDAGHMLPLTDPHLVDPMIAGHLAAADRMRREVVPLAAWRGRAGLRSAGSAASRRGSGCRAAGSAAGGRGG